MPFLIDTSSAMSDPSSTAPLSPSSSGPTPSRSPPAFRQRKSSTHIATPSPASSSSSHIDDNSPSGSASSMPSSSYVDSALAYATADSGISLRSTAPSYKSTDQDVYPYTPSHVLSTPLPSSLTSRRSTPLDAGNGETLPLLSSGLPVSQKWYQGPLFLTGVKLAILFMAFTAVVVGTFWWGIPDVDPIDKPTLKLPRSFADLQALNALFQKYKTQYPYRILACGMVAYLFVQTFSLPGSMYISILFGAAYGMAYGLLLSCLCDSVGSILCYALSALLAPPLLALPFYRARVETWRIKILGDPSKGEESSWDSIFAFLLVLRISPFPPHWVANFVAPHLGIGPLLFWTTCFIGIAPVSVIHVTIGSSLDSMTSAADFHILSLRNVLGLGAVIVAVLIPTGLKRIFRKDLGELGEAEAVLEEASVRDVVVDIPEVHHVLEVDAEGTPRRYQAIDSGVVLAAPSTGDPSLDSPRVDRKGKGRAVFVPRIIDEGFEAPPSTRHEKRPIQNYGAIESLHEMDLESGDQTVYIVYGR